MVLPPLHQAPYLVGSQRTDEVVHAAFEWQTCRVPAVTVLMPTHERPRLLEEALASALNQSYDDIAVLIGDESESDDTEEFAGRIDDPRVRYIRNSPKLGPQGNWLNLVALAETDLVATLHDDDRWHPDFLARAVRHMVDDPTIGMTFTDFWAMDVDGNCLIRHTKRESKRTRRSVIPRGRLDYSLIDGLRLVAVWGAAQAAFAAVLRRRYILATDFPKDVDPLYDIWLCYQLVSKGVGLAYEPERLTYWRVHADSLSGLGYARAEDAVYRRILEENQGIGSVLDEIERTWGRLQWSRGMRLMSTARNRAWSQAELRKAGHHVAGLRRPAATVAAHSPLGWHALRLTRAARHRLTDRTDPRFQAAPR
jgi:glycosyltransferase involved in cell wall biosynthesis